MYLGKKIRMYILTAVAFLATRVTKATEEDDDTFLRFEVLKQLGSVLCIMGFYGL